MSEQQEPEQYTAGEVARLAYLAGRVALKVGRGKSTTRLDAAIERVQADAMAREAVERKRREDAANAKATARAERRARGWAR